MRHLKFAFAAALAVGSLAGRAATTNVCYLLKPADYAIIDWTDDANYDATQGAVPSAGGFLDVRVPDGAKIVVDDAAMDQIRDFFAIKPPSDGELVLSNEVEKTLNVAFTDMGTYSGNPDASRLIVKRGGGRVTLTSNCRRLANKDHTAEGRAAGARLMDYAVSWTIEDGCVDFPGHSDTLDVNTGCMLELGTLRLTTTKAALGLGQMRPRSNGGTCPNSLTGVGTIRRSAHASSGVANIVTETVCTFGGCIEDTVCIVTSGTGKSLTLTNTASTAATSSDWRNMFSAAYGATLQLASFGMTGSPSSAGESEYLLINVGGTLRYLGTGETTDKKIYLRVDPNTAACPTTFAIDAGPSGSLVFDRASIWYAANIGALQMALRGSGTNVMRGSFSYNSNASGNILQLAKDGDGTWAFERNRTYRGAWYVREGVLAFDSLDEMGKECALGTSSALATWETSGRTSTDYAFELGSTSGKVPLLAFTGTNMTWCSTRPVALVGSGGFRNDSECDFRFDGVTSVSGGAKDLVLDGSNANGSEIAGIADSADEAVSIVKTGTGTWTLNGSNTLHGAIRVRAGTLKVRRDPARYTWYKFILRGKLDPSQASDAYTSELCFYGADNRILSSGVTFVGIGGRTLLPGQCVLPRRGSIYRGFATTGPAGGTPARLFDEDCGSGGYWQVSYNRPDHSEGYWGENYREMLDATVSTRAIPLVIRLTNQTDVVKYDVVQRWEPATPQAALCHWTLQGSVDGLHWDELSVVDITEDRCDSGNSSKWASTGLTGTGVSAIRYRTAACYPIATGPATAPAFTVMDNVTSVSVAAGAQFLCEGDAPTVKGLVIDASGAGLVSNVAFAASGTLEVTNVNTRVAAVTLPGVYADAADLANVGGWSLTVNGSARKGYHYSVLVRDGAITLKKKGLVVFLK